MNTKRFFFSTQVSNSLLLQFCEFPPSWRSSLCSVFLSAIKKKPFCWIVYFNLSTLLNMLYVNLMYICEPTFWGTLSLMRETCIDFIDNALSEMLQSKPRFKSDSLETINGYQKQSQWDGTREGCILVLLA